MPSRKQRRRRAKERRHEYEYVYVDEEGREVEVEVEPNGKKDPKRLEKNAPARTRAGRPIQPPSWSKVGKRALMFGPLMFLTIRLLEKKETLTVSLVRTVTLLALFLPFSYIMDSLVYRSHQRRLAKSKEGRP
jgi:hypothetical protein